MNAPLIKCESVDSTNSEALRRLDAGGAAPPFLLVAREQVKGRGRAGKSWASPPGNFYGTFALTADKPDATMAQVSFVAGVALAEVLVDLGLHAQLKWPNDVLVGGAKISGILLEKHGAILLVGMGVNVVSHPDLKDYASTSLRDLGIEIGIETLGAALNTAFQSQYTIWQESGFAPIRQSWLQRAFRLRQVIEVRLPGRQNHRGEFKGLGLDGSLQLSSSSGQGVLSIHAGEVYFHAAGH